MNSSSILLSKKQFKIDLTVLQNTQEKKEIIMHQNCYTDRSYNKLGNNQNNSNLLSLISPKLQKKTESSPIKQDQISFRKPTLKIYKVKSQKLFPAIKSPLNQQEQFNLKDGFKQNQYYNQDITSYRNKSTYNTFMSNCITNESINSTNAVSQNQIMSQRNSHLQFRKHEEGNNEVNINSKQSEKQSESIDQKLKQVKETNNYNALLLNKQKIDQQFLYNSKNQSHRQSLDERSNLQNNKNSQNKKKSELIPKLDFSEYCQIKQQIHSSQQTAEYQLPNQSALLKYKKLNNIDLSSHQIPQMYKNIEDGVYFQPSFEKTQCKNNSKKMSSSLDAPNIRLISLTNSDQKKQNSYMYKSNYQPNQKDKQDSTERKSLIQTFDNQKSDQYFTPIQPKTKIYINNINMSQDNLFINSFLQQKNSLNGLNSMNFSSTSQQSKEQQQSQVANKNTNSSTLTNIQIASLSHINLVNLGSIQASESIQVSQEISQNMLIPQHNQNSLINMQSSQSNYNSSTKQSFNNQNNSITLNSENSYSPVYPFKQNTLILSGNKQSENNTQNQQQQQFTETKVNSDYKNQNLNITNQSPDIKKRIYNSPNKINIQENLSENIQSISPQKNVYSQFINSLNFKNGQTNNNLSQFNNTKNENISKKRTTIDESQLSRQDKPQNELYFSQTSQNNTHQIQSQINNSIFSQGQSEIPERQQSSQSQQKNQSKDESSIKNYNKQRMSQTLSDKLNPKNIFQNEQNKSKQMSDLSQNNSFIDNQSQSGLDNSNVDSNNSQISNNSKWKLNHQHVQKYKKKLKHSVDQLRRYSYSNNSDYIIKIKDNDSEGPNFGSSDLYNQQNLENSADMESSKLSKSISSKKNSTIKPPESVPISQDSFQSMEESGNISNFKNSESKEEIKMIRDMKNPLQNKYDNVSTTELSNDPLFKDYSSTQVVRNFKKKHSYNYALQKQATIISLGNQKLIKLQSQNFGTNEEQQDSMSQAQRTLSRRQTLSGIPNNLSDHKLERKETLTQTNNNSIQTISFDEIKSSSSLSMANVPVRKSIINIIPASNADIPFRSESERKIQLKEQRDQQLEQIQINRRNREKRQSFTSTGDNSSYKLEVIPMSQIQENEDEMYSPQPDYHAMRKRTQTLFVPQLKVSESSPSTSQQSPSPLSNSPSKKKTFNEKSLKKYLNIIKVDLTNYFIQTLKLSDEKEKMTTWINCCMDLVRTVTTPVLVNSVSKDKFDILSEENMKQIGDFIRDRFLEYNFDLQQAFFFHKKFNFMVSQIFRRTLLDQIEAEVSLNELIDEIITKLSEKITHFKKWELEELENIKQATIALLSNNKDILLYYLDNYKSQMNIEPLDFFIIKYTIYKILESKKYSSEIIFDVIEKIEKLRNYLYPNYQFSDSNYRKNLACLLLFNKVLSGYFLDPSISTMQEFIHSLWNCFHGFDSFEKFVEGQKRLMKTQLNSKFFDLLQDFILENKPKSLTDLEVCDLKFKFFKLKQVTNAMQLIPTISSSTSVNSQKVMEELKEMILIKAISKQIPLELTESKVFDRRYVEIFFDFAVKSNKEVMSAFEANLITSAFNTDIQTVNYQLELLKQTLITMGVEQNFIDDVANITQFLIISQINQ